MRREPPLTFGGALKVLGHHERPLVDKIDKLLGGVILGAGVAAVAGAAPAAVLLALWGSVDQKNEAVGLLRAGLDRAAARASGLGGYQRVELVAAAHTILVVSSYFEALREWPGAPEERISAAEKELLAVGRSRRPGEPLVSMLVAAEVPMPGGHCGFVENTELVGHWLLTLSERVNAYAGNDLSADLIAVEATERYQAGYLRLAATVPDFLIWAGLGEHAATRRAVGAAAAGMTAALTGTTTALSRVEALLDALATAPPPAGRLEALARANRGVLHQPVVRSAYDDHQPEGVSFPTVGEGYVNPSYRLAVAGRLTRPADETWWAERSLRTDIDLMIAGHVTTVDATRRPLLLLGHPGSGKSMLTKILAARLPAASYTVVRVPLRQVGANDPIHLQIKQALDTAAHGRTGTWADLADESAETIRIVLLDGLDELLQATSTDRSSYLYDVMEFQRVEADQERPVMVVVTSRTVVAERVDIPGGTLIAKLEEFDDAQVGQWLDAWSRANPTASVRALTIGEALAHEQLARQPLLLLMLALYVADPAVPPITGGLTLTELYRRLLRNFAVREVRKRAGRPLRGTELDEAVAGQLRRLAVAAIGMFNRGRQDITEQELGADLTGLDGGGDEPEASGQRVLGEFFFVHTAEARLRGEARRCYEFLHATFGEYLVASLVTDELADVADAAFGGSRGPREPADDLLFALLSHQPTASRRAILEFAGELSTAMPADERVRVGETLEALIQRYDRRVSADRYPRYRPTSLNHVRQLAAYSANLVLLRVALENEGVPLGVLSAGHEDSLGWWRSIVTLWRAGLDAEGWQGTLGALELSGGITVRSLGTEGSFPPEFADIQYARLLGDRDGESRLRLGAAMRGRLVYYIDGDNWTEMMVSWLTPAALHHPVDLAGYVLADPPPGTPTESIDQVVDLVSAALLNRGPQWSRSFRRQLVSWVDRTAGLSKIQPVALAVAVANDVSLLELPGAADPKLYQVSEATRLITTGGRNGKGRRWTNFVSAVAAGGPPIPAETGAAADRLVDALSIRHLRTSAPHDSDGHIFIHRTDGPIPFGPMLFEL